MKTNFILNHFDKLIVVLLVVIILLSFRNPTTIEDSQQQQSNFGKYQAIYACKDNSGFNVFLILNAETGKFEYRVAYDEANDKQKIYNFLTHESIVLK